VAPGVAAPGLGAAPARVPPAYTPTSTVGRAVAFIELRAHDDISAVDIAAAAFVTIRAVQLAFRRQLGITPLGYLRQIRLERAREQMLSAGSCGMTVSSVAADWHFASASRFAAYYRDAYGELPGETLRNRSSAGQDSLTAASLRRAGV
jgi:transcriptional regulator GlxA family with amidase domain